MLGCLKMKNKLLNRGSSTGKNQNEREAYRQFLVSSHAPDKTVDDDENINKTNASSFREEQEKPRKSIKKSLWLRFKDGDVFKNWLFRGVVVIVVGAIVLGGFNYILQANRNTDNISNLQKAVDKLSDKNDSVESNLNNLNTLFSNFKTEVSVTLDFIKNQLKLK